MTKDEVCSKCFSENWEEGQLDGDVWCNECEEWVNQTLILNSKEIVNHVAMIDK